MATIEELEKTLTIKAKGLTSGKRVILILSRCSFASYRLSKDVKYYEKEMLDLHMLLAKEDDEEKCRRIRLQIDENNRVRNSLQSSIGKSIQEFEGIMEEYKAMFLGDEDAIQSSSIYHDARDAYQSMAAIGFEPNMSL